MQWPAPLLLVLLLLPTSAIAQRLTPRPLTVQTFAGGPSESHDDDAMSFVREADGLRIYRSAGFAAQAGLDVHLSKALRVETEWRTSGAPDEPVIGRVLRAALVRRGDRTEFALGIRPFRWGAADTGDLLMGRTALPRLGISFATARPLDLPFLPQGWGTWTGDTFLQYLDDNDIRQIPRPLLFGHRSEWQPRPYLSLGFSRTILFGGEGRTSRLSPGDLVDIFFGIDENTVGARPPSDSDQKAALHARLTVSELGAWRDLEGSYVYAGEDANGVFPSAVAHQWTAGVARGALAFRLESTETNTGANRWYTHTIYGPAYFYRRLPIGWPYGAGAKIFSGSIAAEAGSWIFATRLTDERMRARNDWRSHRTRVEAWVSRAFGARDRVEFGLETTEYPEVDPIFGIGDERQNPPLETPLDPLDPIGVVGRLVLAWTHGWDGATPTALLPRSVARAFGISPAN